MCWKKGAQKLHRYIDQPRCHIFQSTYDIIERKYSKLINLINYRSTDAHGAPVTALYCICVTISPSSRWKMECTNKFGACQCEWDCGSPSSLWYMHVLLSVWVFGAPCSPEQLGSHLMYFYGLFDWWGRLLVLLLCVYYVLAHTAINIGKHHFHTNFP